MDIVTMSYLKGQHIYSSFFVITITLICNIITIFCNTILEFGGHCLTCNHTLHYREHNCLDFRLTPSVEVSIKKIIYWIY